MEAVVGMEQSSAKRQRGADQGALGSGSGSSTLSMTYMGAVPARVGSGEHERPIMEAVLMGMRDLAMDVQDLKGALYLSWELPMDATYITKGMEFKEQYAANCRKNKGQGLNLGHQKNYIFMGLYVAMMGDNDLTQEEKNMMEELVGAKLREEGQLSLTKAPAIALMVGACQVVRTKKKGFINLALKGPEGQRIMGTLTRLLDKVGTRQGDAGPRSRFTRT